MKKTNLKMPLHHLTDRLAEVKGGARLVVIETGLDGSATSTSTTNPLTEVKGGARAVTIETGDPVASTSPTNPLTTSGG